MSNYAHPSQWTKSFVFKKQSDFKKSFGYFSSHIMGWRQEFRTIDKPVHALNLEDTLPPSTTRTLGNSLGCTQEAETRHIKTSMTIYPEWGKNLPRSVHSDVWIVNLKGFMSAAQLHSTCLNRYRMVRMASWAILHACSRSPFKEKSVLTSQTPPLLARLLRLSEKYRLR